MAQKYSGTPFTGDITSEIVTQSPNVKPYNKPGPKPGAKAAAAAQQIQQVKPVAQNNQTTAGSATGQQTGQHAFYIDKTLVDYLFMRQEELAQKQIVDYDTFIKGMLYVAGKQLSPNSPDTLWSNFLVQLMNRAVQAGSKGVVPR